MLKEYFILRFLFITFCISNVYREGTNVPVLGNSVETYTNGLMNGADPFVFRDSDGTYYLYHTGKGFPVHSSKDLVHWEAKGHAMIGYKWAKRNFWAPEVVKLHGKYFLHYTGAPASGPNKIGMAVSDSPLGPFIDIGNKPFYETGEKGVLDSDIFFDEDGKVYMYYSNAMSTNKVKNQKYSEVWVIELQRDLSGVKGAPHKLTQPEQEWEYRNSPGMFWNEGPCMVKHKGIYYLMYSANCFCTDHYAVGYATSTSPMGPFTKYPLNPILSNEPDPGKISGPGHHAVTVSPDGKEYVIVYHSHDEVNQKGGKRHVNVDRMGFRTDGTMYIDGPTVTEQPLFISTLKDITGEAIVNSSNTFPGSSLKALTDGEFSMYSRFRHYEWKSREDIKNTEISFRWNKKQHQMQIWIYNSIDTIKQAFRGEIVFNDGTTREFEMEKPPGKATIITFDGNGETDGFTLFLKNETLRGVALSEVRIFASP